MKANMLRRWFPVSLLLVGGISGPARGEVLLATADYNNALSPAYVVGQGQTVGARFHVSGTVAVDHIGAHFVRTDGGPIFGAIASLGGSQGVPAGAPGSFNPIAETTFKVNPGTNQSVPLSATLGKGNYAVLFGSDRFGASGSAALSGGNTDKAQSSTFYSNATNWLNGPVAGSRLVVTGTPLNAGGGVPAPVPDGVPSADPGVVPGGPDRAPPPAAPEPTALALACAGVAILSGCRWLQKRVVRAAGPVW
jgi:hypothetical protein